MSPFSYGQNVTLSLMYFNLQTLGRDIGIWNRAKIEIPVGNYSIVVQSLYMNQSVSSDHIAALDDVILNTESCISPGMSQINSYPYIAYICNNIYQYNNTRLHTEHFVL